MHLIAKPCWLLVMTLLMMLISLVLVLILLVLELIPLLLWGVGDCWGLELVWLMISMVMPLMPPIFCDPG